MKASKYRDLTLIDINESQTLVIACDSSGGIGDKENDIVKTSLETVGYFAAQVSIMELLAFGARPIAVIDTLSVEMNPTGERIIEGIKDALRPLDFDMENILTGSTEENFPVSVTGMGITVIGIVDRENFLWPKTEKGFIAALVGVPKLGNEILQDSSDIMNIEETIDLKAKAYIKEILPVGSKGILYELKEMAATNSVHYQLEKDIKMDLYKSAGPSTCVIVSLKNQDFEKLKEESSLPIEKLGEFI